MQESQETTAAAENAAEPPEMLCGETEAAAAVLDEISISIDTLFPTSTSWNCLKTRATEEKSAEAD